MTDFEEKVWLLFFQYVLALPVLALTAHLFSLALERYKSREAMASELAKQRWRFSQLTSKS